MALALASASNLRREINCRRDRIAGQVAGYATDRSVLASAIEAVAPGASAGHERRAFEAWRAQRNFHHQDLMLGSVRQAVVAVTETELQRSSRFIALATALAVTYSVALPLLHLYGIAAEPIEHGRAVYAAIATACYLPLQVWLVVAATREGRRQGEVWALAAMTIVIIGILPVVGIRWLGNSYVAAALVLVIVRRPWSLLFYAIFVAAMAPITFALGHPEWASYYVLGMFFVAMPLAVVLWFIRTARQLQATQLALAEEAVVRERVRIDGELGRTLGAGLDAVAARGDGAGDLVAVDPEAAAEKLRALVSVARRTLADARQMVRRYRDVSLGAELEAAATLLSAAGIDVQVKLPPSELSALIDERQRAVLRRDVGRLLADAPHASVTITVIRHDGQVKLEVLSGTEHRSIEVAFE